MTRLAFILLATLAACASPDSMAFSQDQQAQLALISPWVAPGF